MKLQSDRLDVADLSFHVFERSVHPELLDIRADDVVQQNEFAVGLRLCGSGHAIEFRFESWDGMQTITEIAGAVDPLPVEGLCARFQLAQPMDLSLQIPAGVTYHASAQIELLDVDVFDRMHEELLLDARKSTIAHRYMSHNRFQAGPLSLIDVEPLKNAVVVHAFHTFPDQLAIVKTQSLFELWDDETEE